MFYRGNRDLLALNKTGFLCSRKIPANAVLKSYEWAKNARKEGTCVICGNHSQLEKDVFQILLKGKQPIVLCLARTLYSRWDAVIEESIQSGRLLVISPFDSSIKRISRITAEKRNRLIMELSDDIVVGYVGEGGLLEKLLREKVYTTLIEHTPPVPT